MYNDHSRLLGVAPAYQITYYDGTVNTYDSIKKMSIEENLPYFSLTRWFKNQSLIPRKYRAYIKSLSII